MIARLLAGVRAATRTPVGPGTALLGGVCMVLGASIVQRYVQQQQANLAVAWQQLQMLQTEAQLVARHLGEPYPADEDLDPLNHRNPVDDPLNLADRINAAAPVKVEP